MASLGDNTANNHYQNDTGNSKYSVQTLQQNENLFNSHFGNKKWENNSFISMDG